MPKQTEPGTYLVTGAHRGIGLAFARALAARSDRVVATARRPENARDLAKLSLRLEQLDVANEDSVARLARSLSGEPLDVLINNAGIGDDGPPFEKLSMADLERFFRVNAMGPAAVTQALLPNLRSGKRRTVVNLSSSLGSISVNESGGWIAYRASKAALDQLTRTIAAELKRERFIWHRDLPGMGRNRHGRPRRDAFPRGQRRHDAQSHRSPFPEGHRPLPRPPRQGHGVVAAG